MGKEVAMSAALTELGDLLEARLEQAIVDWRVAHDELTVVVVSDHLLRVLKLLRDDARCQFSVLIGFPKQRPFLLVPNPCFLQVRI